MVHAKLLQEETGTEGNGDWHTSHGKRHTLAGEVRHPTGGKETGITLFFS